MKIALCLSGQCRMFKSSYPALKQYILDHNDCDIFIDTWKFNNFKPEFNQSYRYEDEGTLEELFNLYQPKILNIENFDQTREDQCVNFECIIGTKQGLRSDNYLRRYYSMLYKIFNCNKIKNEYSDKFKINYDLVVRARMDILYREKICFDENIDLAVDHYGNGKATGGDIFAYGKTEKMNIYCNLFNKLNHYFNENIRIETETLLPHHLQNCIGKYIITNYNLDIIRPNIGWECK